MDVYRNAILITSEPGTQRTQLPPMWQRHWLVLNSSVQERLQILKLAKDSPHLRWYLQWVIRVSRNNLAIQGEYVVPQKDCVNLSEGEMWYIDLWLINCYFSVSVFVCLLLLYISGSCKIFREWLFSKNLTVQSGSNNRVHSTGGL